MKYLIVGIGNIGVDYENTRHNIGFDILDSLADKYGVSFDMKRHAFYTQFNFRGRQVHLIKPTTYVNLSGKAVRYWMKDQKIPLDRVLVVLDDLNLPFGKVRIRAKGSDGGHNGLRNINEVLGSHDYARIRFGIGDNFQRGRQVNHVLGQWSEDEEAVLQTGIDFASDAVEAFVSTDISQTMNNFNKTWLMS